jgi:hypothetical protein
VVFTDNRRQYINSYGTALSRVTESGTDPDNAIDTIDDSDMDHLTPYQRKSRLITLEMDKMGMGRYQWYIWSLCGLGYFLDLLWAQAFGLIASPLQRELGFSGMSLANMISPPCTIRAYIYYRFTAGKRIHRI